MYLVCRVENQIQETIQQLKLANIAAEPLILMSCVANLNALTELKTNLTQYDYIFFVSPTSIDICAEIIPLIPKITIFGVMGVGSSSVLAKYTKNNILSPKINTGAMALIEECLNNISLSEKCILIIEGGTAKGVLENYFIENQIQYKKLQVYKREKVTPDLNQLQKIILANDLSGIIITSSELVDCLFDIAKKCSLDKILMRQKFITIHPNIVQTLHKYGVQEVYNIQDNLIFPS